MPNRYTFDFNNQVWKNLRFTIRKHGEESIWYKFLYSIFRFFGEILYSIANYIYDQIFLENADFETLKKTGKHYNIYPYQGESVENFRLRIRTYRSLLSSLLSVSLSKRIIRIYCDVEPEIIQGSDYSDDIFTIGVTPTGTGLCVHSLYWKFVWKVILPDLSGENINRDEIKDIMDDFNIASNEIIIVENRLAGEFVW